jgi:AcrR family transcriptional regulator
MIEKNKSSRNTRERLVEAAASAFSELGFIGASTREIAARADANQGLIAYHFKSKDELWRAAADQLFGLLRTRLGECVTLIESDDPRTFAREAIREYVRFAAAHPELFRLMVAEGQGEGDRIQWLVERHLRPLYEDIFLQFIGTVGPSADETLLPHAYYVLAGAGSLMFALAPECRLLTGVNPKAPDVVEAHAEFVALLLVP